MKRLTIVALAAATICSAAQADDAPRGRLIGNGHDTPREIVAGKDWRVRHKEIFVWLAERSAKGSERLCYKSTGCAYFATIDLDNGMSLSMKIFDDGGAVYCRGNRQNDSLFCYQFNTDVYFAQILDSSTKKWVESWNERTAKGDRGTTPATQPKKTEVEL